MAKVKLSTIYASPTLTAQPGETIDVSAAEAKALIDGRYGDAADGERRSPKREKATAPAAQTATAPPAETAAAPAPPADTDNVRPAS